MPVFLIGHHSFSKVPHLFIMTNEILNATTRFTGLHIAVIGDLMLDHYMTGSTERTSPEAPVPVVLVRQESYVAGGAANVARNIAAAGAQVTCLGANGDDEAGHHLSAALKSSGVKTHAILTTADFQTTTKTRIVSQGQQIVRLDRETQWPASPADVDALCTSAAALIKTCDAVILSDYGKGILTKDVVSRILQECRAANIPVFVDPKGRDYSRYSGAYAITPNSREAHEATGMETSTADGLAAAARAIRQATSSQIVVITRGADGLALLDASDKLTTISTSAREVYDVTGAGDTFVAWLTLAVAAGLSAENAARLANTAAGVSVGRVGPAVISIFDIHQALASGRLGKKLIEESDLPALGDQLRAAGKKIVLTNGCFDFLHAGHVAFLQEARRLGDVLVLAMNTDDSIRRIKGAPRPIISQMQRGELLASIDAVDYITFFEADTPHQVIRALRPDLLVKGSNYTLQQVEGSELVQEYGGQIHTIPVTIDISTSRLVQGIDQPK
jgi:D-beta-D-heptose 7-phosphate kinase/D-beta-D-heptose 1-phosphate adenosyltransferase